MPARYTVLDIETSPIVADVWALWKQNISLNQIREVTRMIGFAAKTVGDSRVEWYSEFHQSREKMVKNAHRILSESDVVIHFNGTTFDMPHLRREFILAGLPPTPPVLEIDLLRVVRKQFRFASNKLQHVSTQLGLEGKKQHSGHDLWTRCMAGDRRAWNEMRAYCKQDVILTEKLYYKLLPWIPAGPHVALFDAREGDTVEDACGHCGCTELIRQGYRTTRLARYPRFQCRKCRSWSQGARAVAHVDQRPS